MSEHFGVYIRKRDMWHLEKVANREAAELVRDANEGFGLETLIAGHGHISLNGWNRRVSTERANRPQQH